MIHRSSIKTGQISECFISKFPNYTKDAKTNKASGYGAVGSALGWGSRGHRFKSCYPDQNISDSNLSKIVSRIISGFSGNEPSIKPNTHPKLDKVNENAIIPPCNNFYVTPRKTNVSTTTICRDRLC